jgi:hypothetical protein
MQPTNRKIARLPTKQSKKVVQRVIAVFRKVGTAVLH